MGKQNGRAETKIKPTEDASKIPGSAGPAPSEGRCSVVPPPPPGPWGEGSNWGQAAEDRSRRVVLSSSGPDRSAVLAFPSSFLLCSLAIWYSCVCWQCLPFTIYSNFSCLLSLALCTSGPACLSSPAQSHLLRADPKIGDSNTATLELLPPGRRTTDLCIAFPPFYHL